MAVYTLVSRNDLDSFLGQYSLGRLLSFEGISKGIENSNFCLTLQDGSEPARRFVLTLFEKRVAEGDLPFFLDFMSHLAARGIQCPKPRASRSGLVILRLNGRPAALFDFMEGGDVASPGPGHCAQAGDLCARLHLAAGGFPGNRPNSMGPQAWRGLFAATAQEMPGDAGLTELQDDAGVVSGNWPLDLPAGAVHADLFPDNVLFDAAGKVSGVLDFYYAATELFAYDLMIAFNAWCFDARGDFLPEQAGAFMDAYTARRPLSPRERAALPFLGRAAALRILATRHYDMIFTEKNALVVKKDPAPYRRIWMHHREKS